MEQSYLYILCLKIPKGLSEAVNQRRTDYNGQKKKENIYFPLKISTLMLPQGILLN